MKYERYRNGNARFINMPDIDQLTQPVVNSKLLAVDRQSKQLNQ